jgi:hypothetical protein
MNCVRLRFLGVYKILQIYIWLRPLPSCERFTCRRFWMSPSGFDLSRSSYIDWWGMVIIVPPPATITNPLYSRSRYISIVPVWCITGMAIPVYGKVFPIFWPWQWHDEMHKLNHLGPWQSDELPPWPDLREVVAIPSCSTAKLGLLGGWATLKNWKVIWDHHPN